MRKCISILVGAILVISVVGAFSPAAAAEGDDWDIVLVRDVGETENISDLEEAGDVLDRYGRYVLLEMPESAIGEIENEYNIDELEHRNQLNIKGHEFDTNDGYPDFDTELMIDEYESGTEGLYIVDMIGPINPVWRAKLEDMGVDVINYQRNYAYEVRMTPELAEDVEDLFFVDWVGIYQPGFKVSENLEIGDINIRLVENTRDETIDQLKSLIKVHSVTELATYGMQVIGEVEDESIFSQLAGMREVYRIANHSSDIEFDSEIATQITGGGCWIWDPENDPNNPYRGHGDYGSLANQLGYTGEGVTIAVADNGFWEEDELDDFQDRVVGGAEYDGEGEWIQNQWGIARHGTHVAGIAAGNTSGGTEMTVDSWLDDFYDEKDADPPGGEIEIGDYYAGQGAAPNAELYLQDISMFPCPDEDEVEDFFSIPQNAVKNSEAYIHTNSWGEKADGTYRISSEAYDKAVRDSNDDTFENEPMVILSSAGNSGYDGSPQYPTINNPGTGKNEITVGATETYNPDLRVFEDQHPPYEEFDDYHVMKPYESEPDNIFENHVTYYDLYGNPVMEDTTGSSRGWTVDDRVKPDVVAPGEGLLSTVRENEYRVKTGTSMATPNVAGSAAVVVEWYEENFGEKPSPAIVKALLINTAYELDNNEPIPNRAEGWGMVNIADLVDPDGPEFILEDNENTLLYTGIDNQYTVSAEDLDEPLKITLTWTDKEAQAFDNPTLKNDLNLEVIAPSGNDIYRGNAFSETGGTTSDSGFTYPNTDAMSPFDGSGDGWDDRNNVQNVYIHPDDLEPGVYTVNIIGENIPADANNDGYANQDYALVAQNAVQTTLFQDLEGDDEEHDLLVNYYEEIVDTSGYIDKIQIKADYRLYSDYYGLITFELDGDPIIYDYRVNFPANRTGSIVLEIDPAHDEKEIKIQGQAIGSEVNPEVSLQKITVYTGVYNYTHEVDITQPPYDGWSTPFEYVGLNWESSVPYELLEDYKVQLNKEGWIEPSSYGSHTFGPLTDGGYTAYVKEELIGGGTVIESRSFTVSTWGGSGSEEFNLNSSYTEELEDGQTTTELRDAFERNDWTLPSDAEISQDIPSLEKYVIRIDRDPVFVIEDLGEELAVYKIRE